MNDRKLERNAHSRPIADDGGFSECKALRVAYTPTKQEKSQQKLERDDHPKGERLFKSDPPGKNGPSTRTFVHRWEAADGSRAQIAQALGQTLDPLLVGLIPLLAVP